MEQYPSEQNSMQISGAANSTWSEDDEMADIGNQFIFDNYEGFFKFVSPGYRFIPTDEELIEHYLKKKVNNEILPHNLILDVTFYSKDPTQLVAENKPITENEWYFFTPRDKKYPNGSRPNRATPNGYWKATGTYKNIPQSHGSRHPIGYKRTLDFLEGKHPRGSKTVWKMHEYTLTKDDDDNNNNNHNSLNIDRPRVGGEMRLDDWVLCRLYKNQRSGGDEANISGGGTPTVNVTQNKEAANSTAGNSNFGFDSQQIVNVPLNNQVMAGNMRMASFKYQNPYASQPTPNQASTSQQSVNFQSFHNANSPFFSSGNSIANSPQYPNVLWSSRATPNWYSKPTRTNEDVPLSHGYRHPVGYKRTLDYPRGSETVRRRHHYTLFNSSNNYNFQNNGRPGGHDNNN